MLPEDGIAYHKESNLRFSINPFPNGIALEVAVSPVANVPDNGQLILWYTVEVKSGAHNTWASQYKHRIPRISLSVGTPPPASVRFISNLVTWDVNSVVSNADWTAVDTGFAKSNVWSTLISPISDFVMSAALALKLRLLRILEIVYVLNMYQHQLSSGSYLE